MFIDLDRFCISVSKAWPPRGSSRIGVTRRRPTPVNRLWVHFFPGFVGLRLWIGLIKIIDLVCVHVFSCWKGHQTREDGDS